MAMRARFVAVLIVSLAACIHGFAPVRSGRALPARSKVSGYGYGHGTNTAVVRHNWTPQDDGQGNIYYYNEATGESSWDPPTTSSLPGSPNAFGGAPMQTPQ
eukprot:CAMPEP_0182567744 /NCGR_PEP_ID=MMETSP1324-20130603/8884_1 /TAXON_ID=236786 /ORGANISM="Florenciella sp., Strain RCC1587" /LENGTH=101 /DNA_ID=CAMNT_0024781787 /DNA_START=10 /DNA_END=312 /DNA_ORIENTATION=+